jgi:hypothetical protein
MSTCTFAPEENEQNAARFLTAHPEFEPVDLSRLPFGSPSLPPYTRGRRIWPWQGGEGHFLALFRKRGDAPGRWLPYQPPKRDPWADKGAELYRSLFAAPPRGTFVTLGDTVRLLPADMPATRLHLLGAGIAAAEIKKDRLEPAHSLFAAALPADCLRRVDPADPLPFLRGETVACDPALSGFAAVTAAFAIFGSVTAASASFWVVTLASASFWVVTFASAISVVLTSPAASNPGKATAAQLLLEVFMSKITAPVFDTA